MLILIILIALSYASLMISFLIGWKKLPETSNNYATPKTRFSIIIPFRNEADNLPKLLESLSILNYPTMYFEVMLVNDASEDESEKIITEFIKKNLAINLRLLQNKRRSPSPKKDALQTAIEISEFDYIATTDADCELPEYWLQSLNTEIINQNPAMLAAPVKIDAKNSRFLTAFEALDFLSLQLCGAGAFGLQKAFMANGANLCYKKDTFIAQNGFTGNTAIASGDDVFLLQKFIASNEKVSFLKDENAIVSTPPQVSFQALKQQRIRWASKTSAYTSNFAKLTGIIVFLMNFAFAVGLVSGIFKLFPFFYFMILFLVKFNIDFVVLHRAASFFKCEKLMKNYLISSILYPFFTIYVAILSLFGGYQWKGRQFSR
ncbi:glycosyltransferase [Zunongwangia sp.]|uniref:glycosyltransferase n=1 Tax=Zunongwangia sp. TaxID=1965325 RepID=UPI003AA7EE78